MKEVIHLHNKSKKAEQGRPSFPGPVMRSAEDKFVTIGDIEEGVGFSAGFQGSPGDLRKAKAGAQYLNIQKQDYQGLSVLVRLVFPYFRQLFFSHHRHQTFQK